MFDVFILEKDTQLEDLPQSGVFYLITSDGLYIHKDEPMWKGLVKINHHLPFLGTITPNITLNAPKLPGDILQKARLFFRRVFKELHAESELNLHYHKEKDQFLLVCRPQYVSHGGVKYGISREKLARDEEAKENLLKLSEQGYWKVGTIHSHCDFEAFHSGTDRHDESTKDGLHITVGHVDKDQFSLSASLVSNDSRLSLQPENVIMGIEPCLKKGGENFYITTLPAEEQQAIAMAFLPTLDEWVEMVGSFYKRRPVYSPANNDRYSRVPTLVRTPLHRELLEEAKKPAEEVIQGQPIAEVAPVEGQPIAEVAPVEGQPIAEVAPVEGQPIAEVAPVEGQPIAEVAPVEGQPIAEVATVEGQPIAEVATVIENIPSGPVIQGRPILAFLSEKELRKVRSHASALKYNSAGIPTLRIRELVQTLEGFFGRTEITSEDINLAVRINPVRGIYEET